MEHDKYKWYILRVSSGSEERVINAISEISKRLNIGDDFGEIYIPYKEVINMKGNKKVVVRQKVSPGYIFLRMVLSDGAANVISTLSQSTLTKSCSFLSDSSGAPKIVLQSEIDEMKKNISQQLLVDDVKERSFDPGDQVIINDGSFQNINGTVEHIKCVKTSSKEEKKVAVVSIFIFGRSVNVEFELDCIEKKV